MNTQKYFLLVHGTRPCLPELRQQTFSASGKGLLDFSYFLQDFG